MSKHTPRPWVLDAGISSNVVLIDSKATNGAVGEIVDCRNRADAILIAAAPDLLEALTLLVAGIENSVSDTYIPLVKARAAIAKATGEQA